MLTEFFDTYLKNYKLYIKTNLFYWDSILGLKLGQSPLLFLRLAKYIVQYLN